MTCGKVAAAAAWAVVVASLSVAGAQAGGPQAEQKPAAQTPAAAGQKAKPAPDKLVAEGRAAYEKADYGSALLKFEEAAAAGASGGEFFYQMGFCYRTVRDDAEKGRSYMAQALPLLQQQVKDPARRDLRSYYYLAAIRLNEIPDPDDLARLSKEAVRAIESGALPKPVSGDDLFQAGRLYGFAGERDKAVAHYEKAIAALEKSGPGKEGILRHCLEASADAAVQKQDWDKATGLYSRLLKADPSRDDVRLPLALTLFKTGHELDAIPYWRETRDPRVEGDKVYLERVARHYVELDRPAVQAPAESEALRTAIVEAAKVYAEARKKDDDAAKAAADKWQEEETAARKQRRKAKSGTPPPSIEDLEKIPPEKLTAEQRLRLMGYNDIALEPPPPPPSPERIAAEKKFFGLLAEMVRRGQLVQDFAVTNGLAPLIFK